MGVEFTSGLLWLRARCNNELMVIIKTSMSTCKAERNKGDHLYNNS